MANKPYVNEVSKSRSEITLKLMTDKSLIKLKNISFIQLGIDFLKIY